MKLLPGRLLERLEDAGDVGPGDGFLLTKKPGTIVIRCYTMLQVAKQHPLTIVIVIGVVNWCPSSLAQLVKSNFTWVYGRHTELLHGGYEPTCNWGAPPCSSYSYTML